VGHVWRAEASLIKKVTENNREKDQEADLGKDGTIQLRKP